MAERRTAIQLKVAAGVKRISWVSNLSIDELGKALARRIDDGCPEWSSELSALGEAATTLPRIGLWWDGLSITTQSV
jgi:hypothetical protein